MSSPINKVAIVWFRRDLRVDDNIALLEAVRCSNYVVPLYIWAPEEDGQFRPGRCSRWWAREALLDLEQALKALGTRLVIKRSEDSVSALTEVVQAVGATDLYYNALYDPISVARDQEVCEAMEKLQFSDFPKSQNPSLVNSENDGGQPGACKEVPSQGLAEARRGLVCHRCAGDLLYEPWEILDEDMQPFYTFESFWKKVESMTSMPPMPLPAPSRVPPLPPTARRLGIAVQDVDWFASPEEEVTSDQLKFQWNCGVAGAVEILEEFLNQPLPPVPAPVRSNLVAPATPSAYPSSDAVKSGREEHGTGVDGDRSSSGSARVSLVPRHNRNPQQLPLEDRGSLGDSGSEADTHASTLRGEEVEVGDDQPLRSGRDDASDSSKQAPEKKAPSGSDGSASTGLLATSGEDASCCISSDVAVETRPRTDVSATDQSLGRQTYDRARKPPPSSSAVVPAAGAGTVRTGGGGAWRRCRHGGLAVFSTEKAQVDCMSTSRLSPWIRSGTLSVRYVYYKVKQREAEWVRAGRSDLRASCRAFLRQLGLREFSRYLCHHFPHLHTRALLPHLAKCPWNLDPAKFKRWRQGQTGYPLVDAAMRQLWLTGWLHNRLRVLAASFLVKDLLLPWQWGLRHFWDAQIDADLETDALGWQYASGGLADAHPFSYRVDVASAAARFDPDGEYVRRWVPQLGRLPAGYIHEPWKAPPVVLRAADVELGLNYPRPIVSEEEALRNVHFACTVLEKHRVEKERQELGQTGITTQEESVDPQKGYARNPTGLLSQQAQEDKSAESGGRLAARNQSPSSSLTNVEAGSLALSSELCQRTLSADVVLLSSAEGKGREREGKEENVSAYPMPPHRHPYLPPRNLITPLDEQLGGASKVSHGGASEEEGYVPYPESDGSDDDDEDGGAYDSSVQYVTDDEDIGEYGAGNRNDDLGKLKRPRGGFERDVPRVRLEDLLSHRRAVKSAHQATDRDEHSGTGASAAISASGSAQVPVKRPMAAPGWKRRYAPPPEVEDRMSTKGPAALRPDEMPVATGAMAAAERRSPVEGDLPLLALGADRVLSGDLAGARPFGATAKPEAQFSPGRGSRPSRAGRLPPKGSHGGRLGDRPPAVRLTRAAAAGVAREGERRRGSGDVFAYVTHGSDEVAWEGEGEGESQSGSDIGSDSVSEPSFVFSREEDLEAGAVNGRFKSECADGEEVVSNSFVGGGGGGASSASDLYSSGCYTGESICGSRGKDSATRRRKETRPSIEDTRRPSVDR